MAWPSSLGSLLARSDSRAALALRWGLHGLRASLQAALQEVSDDPGGEDLRGLLAELTPLLDGAGTFSAPAELPPAAEDVAGREIMPPSGVATPRLLPLARAVAADPRLREWLHKRPLREDSDEEIWNDIQLLLLRVPPALADEWQRRCLSHAEKAGALADETHAAVLSLERDERIFPGLTGTVQAQGLRSETGAPLDPRVTTPPEEDLRFLAGVASAWLWFIEQDPQLHHCLAGVFRFGLAALAGEQRERYVAELLRRWDRVCAGAQTPSSRQGWKDRLKEHLDLDEALHSLVHTPPADPRSWWGQLCIEARDSLLRERDRAAQAGCPAHLQLLGGSFADINRLAPDSLQVDFGVPGEVAACLRVWARIDGEELKGRVLYRPPREEA
jgi:hypothetical protein